MKQDPKFWEEKTREFLCDWYGKYGSQPDVWEQLSRPILGIEKKDVMQINNPECFDYSYREGENVDYKRIRYLWNYQDVRERLMKAKSFIDIGGGPGGCLYFLFLLLGMPSERRFVVLDFSGEAKKRFYDYCYDVWGEFIHCNINDYEEVEQFDVVMCFQTLEHLDDIYLGLQKMWNLTTPGGLLLCSVPHSLNRDGDTHMWLVDHDGIFHVIEERWHVPVTFYPWVWPWCHMYFSVVKQDEVHDPIAEWEKDIFKDIARLEAEIL